MELRCTCGAYLPEDARFCHKCGKPQYEEDLERIREQEAAPPPPVQAPMLPPGVGGTKNPPHRNYRALVISLMMAAGAMLCSMLVAGIPGIAPFLFLLVLLAAGFFAAVLYGRHTHTRVTAIGGAFLGWLTGMWLFLPFLLMFISPAGADAMRQLQTMPQIAQLMEQNPHQLMAMMVFALFWVLTFIPGIGGILGASMAGRGRQTS